MSGPRDEGAIFELVERAAETAAQKIAAINRRRIVRQTFLVAFTIAIAIATAVSLPVALIANHERALATTANSRYNCRLLTNVAGVFHDFIESDAKLRADQQNYASRSRVLSGFEKIIPSKLLRELIRRSDALDRASQAYWRGKLLPRVRALARINCSRVLTADGPAAP